MVNTKNEPSKSQKNVLLNNASALFYFRFDKINKCSYLNGVEVALYHTYVIADWSCSSTENQNKVYYTEVSLISVNIFSTRKTKTTNEN